jgi:hypothetical protein
MNALLATMNWERSLCLGHGASRPQWNDIHGCGQYLRKRLK